MKKYKETNKKIYKESIKDNKEKLQLQQQNKELFNYISKEFELINTNYDELYNTGDILVNMNTLLKTNRIDIKTILYICQNIDKLKSLFFMIQDEDFDALSFLINENKFFKLIKKPEDWKTLLNYLELYK